MEWCVLWDLYEVGLMMICDFVKVQCVDYLLLSCVLLDMCCKGYVEMQCDIDDGCQIIVYFIDVGQVVYVEVVFIMLCCCVVLCEIFIEIEIVDFVGYLDWLQVFLQ